MENRFLSFLKLHNLLNLGEGQSILSAISGGVDSMVMLHLFIKSHIPIKVAHCNFSLRPEADGDAEWVAAICRKADIPFFCQKFDTQKYARENKLSIQMAARELRYQWFDELLTKENCNKIATAHHINDSLETLLMNIIHAGGWEGMSGIKVSNGVRIRPLLFATRDEIMQYAVEHKIQWREDQSNASLDYERNFIRHKIIPQLRQINPSLEKTFTDFQYKMDSASFFIQFGIEKWKEKFITKKGEEYYIPKEVFDTPALWILLQPFGFNVSQVQQIAGRREGQSGKFFLSDTHQATIDREFLVIKKKSEPLPVLEVNLGRCRRGKWELNLRPVENRSGYANLTYLDFDKLKFPLIWRTWKEGDFFYPLGMEHRKKISDFLIDQKIPLSDKEDVSVLLSDGQICWVTGMRIDNRFKVLPETKRILELELTAVDFLGGN